jgi:hypothetical protein
LLFLGGLGLREGVYGLMMGGHGLHRVGLWFRLALSDFHGGFDWLIGGLFLTLDEGVDIGEGFCFNFRP